MNVRTAITAGVLALAALAAPLALAGTASAAPADNPPGQAQACAHAAEPTRDRGLAERCTPAPPPAPPVYSITNRYPITDENGRTVGLWMSGGVHNEDRPIADSVRLRVETDPAETGTVVAAVTGTEILTFTEADTPDVTRYSIKVLCTVSGNVLPLTLFASFDLQDLPPLQVASS